jgi:hypothetical protein
MPAKARTGIGPAAPAGPEPALRAAASVSNRFPGLRSDVKTLKDPTTRKQQHPGDPTCTSDTNRATQNPGSTI